ncbi:uncharacterized protein [Branchiostoma lanceolatum]|uniref:uncharacterized protein n=1 Tax=Branchiostoma lanceolatum TaxID=7740 RepID=UPI00345676B2
MISLGWLSEDGQGGQLHAATRKGKVHNVKKLLKEGTRVDYPNSRDQTALFCACYLGKEKTVKLLLKYGANANERSDNGSTPVHAAAWSCKTGILLRLVRAGGNIRLHDNEGRTPKDWALERDKKKNKKMLILLDQMYMHAVALSNGEITTIMETKSSASSLLALHPNMPRGKKSVELLGYGRMYTGSGNNQPSGYISTIPIIPETQLSKVEGGSSAFKYVTGGFFTVQKMNWNHSRVTVKQLERTEDRARLDLLMDEVQTLGHLRHPNLLLLMAVTHSALLDNMMLVFEQVESKTLFYLLHQERLLFKEERVVSFLLQICEALIYIHTRGILHCCITSHAAYITHGDICKLGNFEYAVKKCENQALQKKSLVLQNSRPLAAYNWLAPEIHAGRPPTTKSDIYSFCALIFEIYTGQVPFESLEAHDFRRHVATGKRLLQMEEGSVPLGLDHLVTCGLSYRGVDRLTPLTSYREQLCRELEVLQPPNKSPGQVSRCTYTVGASPSCLGQTTMDTTQDSMTDQDLVASLPDCLDENSSIQCNRTSSMKKSPNRRLLPKQGSLSAFDTSDKENLPPFPPKFQTVLDNALHAVSNIREDNFTFQESPIHWLSTNNRQAFHEKSAASEADEGVVIIRRDHHLKIYNNPEDIEIYDTYMPGQQHTHSTPIVTSRLLQRQQPVLKESPLQPHYEPSTSSSLMSKRWSFLARKSKSVGQLIQSFEAKARGQGTKSNRASQSELAAQDADPSLDSAEREEMSSSEKEKKQMEAKSNLNGSDEKARSKESPIVTSTSKLPDKDDSTTTISEANTTDLHWQSAIDGSAATVTDYQELSKADDSAVSLSLDGKESFYMEAQEQDSVIMSTMEAGSSTAPIEVHHWPQQVEKQQSPCVSNNKAQDIASIGEGDNVEIKDSEIPANLLDRQHFLDYRFKSLQECQAMDKMSFTTDSSFISSGTEESSDSEVDSDSGSSTSKESLQLDPASHALSKNGGASHVVHNKLLQSLQERSAFEDDLTQISALEMSVTSLDQQDNGAKGDSPSTHSNPMAREDEDLTTEDQPVPVEGSHLAKVQASLTSRSRNDSILSETSLEVSAITSSAVLNYSTSISNTRRPDSESKDGSITSTSSLEVSSLTKALEEIVPIKSQLTNIRMLESPTVKAVEMSESSSDGSEGSEDGPEDNWMLGDGQSKEKIVKDTQPTATLEKDRKMEFTREVETFGRGDCMENRNGVDGEHGPQMCDKKKTRVETYV